MRTFIDLENRYRKRLLAEMINSRKFKLLACFCDCKGRFVSGLVGNQNCYDSIYMYMQYVSAGEQRDVLGSNRNC